MWGVDYRGRKLGTIEGDSLNHNALTFIAENLDALVTLLSLESEDVLETYLCGPNEQKEEMRFDNFKETYLKPIAAYYPSQSDWNLRIKNSDMLVDIRKVDVHPQRNSPFCRSCPHQSTY